MTRLFAPLAIAAAAALAAAAPARAQSFDVRTAPWLTERKILGEDDLLPIETALGTRAYKLARAVLRIEFADGFGFCTAFRVGKHYALTNLHCDQGCDDMRFRAGYEEAARPADQHLYRCVARVADSKELDYALYQIEETGFQPGQQQRCRAASTRPEPVALADAVAASTVRSPTLTLSRQPVEAGIKLYVASFPVDRYKLIDRSPDCVLTTAEPEMTSSGREAIRHMCDTEGGSSGAPLIERRTGRVVGLHYGGIDGEYNTAVPMWLIVADLEAKLDPHVFDELAISR